MAFTPVVLATPNIPLVAELRIGPCIACIPEYPQDFTENRVPWPVPPLELWNLGLPEERTGWCRAPAVRAGYGPKAHA